MGGIPSEVFHLVQPMIKRWEGFYPSRYDDGTGVITIGYGFIASDFGGAQNMPEHMTEAQADAKLTQLLNESYYPPVAALNKQLGGWMNPNMLASVTDAVYNLGDGILESTHTFGHYLHAKDKEGAANALLLYSMPGTPVHEGLLHRREDEQRLFLKRYVAPDPYLIYPDERFGPQHLNERDFAKLVDGWLKHTHLHHHQLEEAHAGTVFFRRRMWIVSVFEPPTFTTKRQHADWSNHRGTRYQHWFHRMKAIEALKP